jgi:hypothetical protein
VEDSTLHLSAAARMKPGDRIKLTERGARAQTHFNKPHPVDWFKRRGTVVSVSAQYVYIRWDGRKSVSYEPIAIVELAED